MTYETITVERCGDIEILGLDRPQVLNALSDTMLAELDDYTCGLLRRPVRVVVLRGNGRAFCAGLDLKDYQPPNGEGDVQRSWRIQLSLAEILKRLRRMPQPLIALGRGAACGGGFSLLLAADVRLGAPSLRMNAAYIKIGLGGADMGTSYFLPRLVGAGVAAELLLTGRFIDAERALGIGLLNRIVAEEDLLDAGLALADEMLANAPLGLALTKAALNLNIDAPSIDAAFALEDRQQVMLVQTEDHREAVDAFAARRPPAYRGR